MIYDRPAFFVQRANLILRGRIASIESGTFHGHLNRQDLVFLAEIGVSAEEIDCSGRPESERVTRPSR